MKLKTKIIIIDTSILFIIVLYSVCCMRSGVQPRLPEENKLVEKLEWDDAVIEPVVVVKKEPAPIPTKRKFVRYEYRLEYQFSKIRYTTCYTGFDKGDPGHGKYANQNFADKLHLYERRIKYEHNTVALCPEDKKQHEELIQMPDGAWTHKWRIHIDGVHQNEITEKTDSDYFGVPRDRMKQSGRIDFLITQAGKYNSLDQRVRNWKSLKRKIEYWKWKVYRLYDDGLMEEIE